MILKALISWPCKLCLLIGVLILSINIVESAEINSAENSSDEDDGGSCTITPEDLPEGKISHYKLREYEEIVFGTENNRLCGRDIQQLISIFRQNHELSSGSRLSPEYHELMDQLRWLDEITERKCRIDDFYDRAVKVSVISERHPILKGYLRATQREQNRDCLDNLRWTISQIYENDQSTISESSNQDKPGVKQRKLTVDHRRIVNFLRYNLEMNKKDSSVKLHEFISADTYFKGAAEFLLPRAKKWDKSKQPKASGQLLSNLKMKYYESEFNRLVYDACDSVYREMYQLKNYFENIMQIMNVSETNVHFRVLEAIGDARVCEIVVTKKYPFKGVFDTMLKISDENKAMYLREKSRKN